mgnify:CR=1 FL=1
MFLKEQEYSAHERKKGMKIMGVNFWIAPLCTYEFLFSIVLTEPAEGLKIRGVGDK